MLSGVEVNRSLWESIDPSAAPPSTLSGSLIVRQALSVLGLALPSGEIARHCELQVSKSLASWFIKSVLRDRNQVCLDERQRLIFDVTYKH